MMATPLVHGAYLLQKFPGKGGWTFAVIPEIPQDAKKPFGSVQVKGMIDSFELKRYNLMPMGQGRLFLPVRAEIRKRIAKQAGDYVILTLYIDDSAFELPEGLLQCLEMESPKLLERFLNLPESHRKAYVDWIYEAKKEDTKARRIVRMIERLEQHLSFYDKDKTQP